MRTGEGGRTRRGVDLVYRELVANQRARLPKPLQRVEASQLLSAIQAGVLLGIYQQDQKVPADSVSTS